ncbi:MAG: hypothetical protein MPK06_02065 [Alphaproteobacteria bacterium]|nr:hypothetical protein [Alphaproteobacteria bacterium]MDA8003353.1 hypothetical protein [Alphaproteobacteria bacterium]MDA8005313.1 hypothetical protein [Alphaproteobacteria bacterium]MDA8012738.1 hypothetical protein [Alphaproteobacteria bacterium]
MNKVSDGKNLKISMNAEAAQRIIELLCDGFRIPLPDFSTLDPALTAELLLSKRGLLGDGNDAMTGDAIPAEGAFNALLNVKNNSNFASSRGASVNEIDFDLESPVVSVRV